MCTALPRRASVGSGMRRITLKECKGAQATRTRFTSSRTVIRLQVQLSDEHRRQVIRAMRRFRQVLICPT